MVVYRRKSPGRIHPKRCKTGRGYSRCWDKRYQWINLSANWKNKQPVGQVAPQALPDKWRVIPDKGIVRELASLAPWPTRWEEYRSAQGQEVKNCIQVFSGQLGCEVVELNIQQDHIHLISNVPRYPYRSLWVRWKSEQSLGLLVSFRI